MKNLLSTYNIKALLVALLSIILIVLSFVFYKERVGYADSPGYLTDMVSLDGFSIHHSRFISVLFEWLSWAFMKMGLPFKWLVIGYSFGHMLFPVFLALICLLAFRMPDKALMILFFWILMSARLTYFTCSEFQYGLCLVLFIDAAASFSRQRAAGRIPFALFSLCTAPFVVFSHPLAILAVASWIVYRIIKNGVQDKFELIIVGVSCLSAFIIKRLFFISGYEIEKNKTVRPFEKISLDIYHNHLAKGFYKDILNEYFLVPVLFVITMFWLIRSGKKLQAIFLPVTIACFMGLIFFSFEQENYSPYMEHFLQPIPLLILLVFFDNLENQQLSLMVNTIALFAIAAISVCKVINGAAFLTKRHAWYEEKFKLMNSCHRDKALIIRDDLPSEEDKFSYWNAANESMVLSSIKGPDSAKTIFLCWGHIRDSSMLKGKEPVILFDSYEIAIDKFPKKYFNFQNSLYVQLKGDSCLVE